VEKRWLTYNRHSGLLICLSSRKLLDRTKEMPATRCSRKAELHAATLETTRCGSLHYLSCCENLLASISISRISRIFPSHFSSFIWVKRKVAYMAGYKKTITYWYHYIYCSFKAIFDYGDYQISRLKRHGLLHQTIRNGIEPWYDEDCSPSNKLGVYVNQGDIVCMLTPLFISGSGTDGLVFCCHLDTRSDDVSAARANKSWQNLLAN
jgi:hypothetical protein